MKLIKTLKIINDNIVGKIQLYCIKKKKILNILKMMNKAISIIIINKISTLWILINNNNNLKLKLAIIFKLYKAMKLKIIFFNLKKKKIVILIMMFYKENQLSLVVKVLLLFKNKKIQESFP